MLNIVYNTITAGQLETHPSHFPYIAHNYDPLSYASQNLADFQGTIVASQILICDFICQGQYSIYHQSQDLPRRFIYPIGPQWVDDASIKNYSIDQKIKSRLEDKTAWLLYSDPCEGKFYNRLRLEKNSIEGLYMAMDQEGIDTNQLIIINNACNLAKMNKKLRKDHTHRAKAIFLPWLRTRYHDEYQANHSLPSKRFVCLNNTWKAHRMLLALEIKHRDLMKDFYYAFLKVAPGSQLDKDPYRSLRQNFNKSFTEIVYPIEEELELRKLIDKFYLDLPLTLDQGFQPRVSYVAEDISEFHKDSLISLVTETYFVEDEIHITEKTFRAISLKHPFILVASYQTLEYLKQQGFKTFNDFWDESYDLIRDPYQRLQKILKIVEEISAWSLDNLLEFKNKTREILEYNFDHLGNLSRNQQRNTKELENLRNYFLSLNIQTF